MVGLPTYLSCHLLLNERCILAGHFSVVVHIAFHVAYLHEAAFEDFSGPSFGCQCFAVSAGDVERAVFTYVLKHVGIDVCHCVGTGEDDGGEACAARECSAFDVGCVVEAYDGVEGCQPLNA